MRKIESAGRATPPTGVRLVAKDGRETGSSFWPKWEPLSQTPPAEFRKFRGGEIMAQRCPRLPPHRAKWIFRRDGRQRSAARRCPLLPEAGDQRDHASIPNQPCVGSRRDLVVPTTAGSFCGGSDHSSFRRRSASQ